jgi:hypothetical protein
MNMKYPAKALRNFFKCYIALQGANPWLLVHYVRAYLNVWSCTNISHIQDQLFTFFSNHCHKTKIGTANWWETTDSNPLQPVKLCSQLTTDVTVCSAMYWPHDLVHKRKAQSCFEEKWKHARLAQQNGLGPGFLQVLWGWWKLCTCQRRV